MDSVFAQTYPHWQIIFYDNLSTDSSPEIAKSYGDQVLFIRGKKPLPLGEARNEAMKHATNDLVAFLDCDDIWLPTKLETQVKTFEKNPNVGVAHAAYYVFFDDTAKLTRVGAESAEIDTERKTFREQLVHYTIGIMTVIFRRKLLEGLPIWFDPRFNLVEDGEFFLKLMYLAPVAYNPEPLSKYRVHKTNLSKVLRTDAANEFEDWRLCLEKLVPNYKQEYAVEDRVLESRIAFFRARDAINAGNSTLARTHLQEFRFYSPRMFMYYVLSFFPATLWQRLYRIYFRLRYF